MSVQKCNRSVVKTLDKQAMCARSSMSDPNPDPDWIPIRIQAGQKVLKKENMNKILCLKSSFHWKLDPDWIQIQQQPGSGSGFGETPGSRSGFSVSGFETLVGWKVNILGGNIWKLGGEGVLPLTKYFRGNRWTVFAYVLNFASSSKIAMPFIDYGITVTY
jgi:hypothetical protein